MEIGDVYRQNEDGHEVTVEKIAYVYVYVRNNVSKRQTEILRRFFGASSKKGWTKVMGAAKVADVSSVDLKGLGTGDATKPEEVLLCGGDCKTPAKRSNHDADGNFYCDDCYSHLGDYA